MSKQRKKLGTQTGMGRDRKGTRRDGLRFRWQWSEQRMLSGAPESDHRRLPCQICFAKMPTEFGVVKFEAIDWNESYEARVALVGNRLASESGLSNRLAAQRCAEALGREVCEAILLQVYGIKRRE